MVTVTCPCGVEFEAKSPNAKWHSTACRQRHVRSGVRAGDVAAPKAAPSVNRSRSAVSRAGADVLKVTRSELKRLNATDTLEGRQAILLATRIADPTESGAGVARLTAELTALMREVRGARPVADPVSDAQASVLSIVRGGVA